MGEILEIIMNSIYQKRFVVACMETILYILFYILLSMTITVLSIPEI